MRPVRVAITMGDPAGIGPEVIVKALRHPLGSSDAQLVVIGDMGILRRANDVTGGHVAIVEADADSVPRWSAGVVPCLNVGRVAPGLRLGVASAEGGAAAYRYIDEAVRLCLGGAYDAICTAPINKEALHLAGYPYPGHTELLAHLSGTVDVAMILAGETLRVAHVTTHMGLLEAIRSITPERVLRVIELSNDALYGTRTAGTRPLRIGVCGINPHAGEEGLFGDGEEARLIEPALDVARGRGLDVRGPLPADTAFWLAAQGDLDLVVAMYHDQGHGPVKVLGLEAGVNVTAGLPFVRTSVDHGTAFDIVGTGTAKEGSMRAAIQEAISMAATRQMR